MGNNTHESFATRTRGMQVRRGLPHACGFWLARGENAPRGDDEVERNEDISRNICG